MQDQQGIAIVPKMLTSRLATIRLALLAAVLLLQGGATVGGASGDKQALAYEVVLALGVPRQMAQLEEYMKAELTGPQGKQDQPSLAGLDPAPAAAPLVASFSSQFAAYQPQVLSEVAELYAELFTAEELRTIAAFYKSSAGTKLVALSPELVEQTTQIGLAYGQQAMDRATAP